MRFKDKVAIITGGGSGMGKAAALGFVREGAFVVVNDRDEELLNSTVDEIRSIGGTIIAVEGDVTKRAVRGSLVTKAIEQYDKIDILFNHVGGEPPGSTPLTPFIEQDEDYWDSVIELNLKSTILVCRAVLDQMIKQRYGKIINMGAMAGRIAVPRLALYSAVKGGVIAFTKALAFELAPYSINVNCVSPGPIKTLGYKKVFADVDEGEVLAIVPLKRVGRPEDVASAVLYLASDDASFITGQTLAVDGGATMV